VVPPKRAGYYTASAKPERVLHDDSHTLDLRVAFTMGPLFHFGQLVVVGLTPNGEEQARNRWKMKPGAPYDYRYPFEFMEEFSHVIDFRNFKIHRAVATPGPGDHVMNVMVEFLQN
jgi:hypothetical protein